MKLLKDTCFWRLQTLGLLLVSLTVYAKTPEAAHSPAGNVLTLQQAIALAQRNDPWLTGNRYRQASLEAQSVAAGTLPDPVVSVGVANLPTDTYDFDQEAMTQLKVGIAQQFPRGDSLALRQRQLSLRSDQHPFQRQDRKARIAVTVGHLWLDAYRANASIRLIERDRDLFEHLVDVAQSSYTSALAHTGQQDLIRAQLELTRLEDRLAVLHEQQAVARSRLLEWLKPERPDSPASHLKQTQWQGLDTGFELPGTLPNVSLQLPVREAAKDDVDRQGLLDALSTHPAIRNLEQKIASARVGVELAEQQYKLQWGVNASYGYREEDALGQDRADFFSVGVTFDLPLFTARRQDQQVQSAISSAEAVKTEKALALRNLLARFEAGQARLQRLSQRQALYRSRLLQQMHDQAEAALAAYTHDVGDFSEVVRARIAELNARIDALDIAIDRLKTLIELNYFVSAGGDQVAGKASGDAL